MLWLKTRPGKALFFSFFLFCVKVRIHVFIAEKCQHANRPLIQYFASRSLTFILSPNFEVTEYCECPNLTNAIIEACGKVIRFLVPGRINESAEVLTKDVYLRKLALDCS